MASPTSNIKYLVVDEETKRQQNLSEVETAIADNKEAVLATITLVRHLQDTGILAILNGLLAEGEDVLRIVVQEINKPHNSNVLENGLDLAMVLGTLDVDGLKILTEKLNQGIKEATAEDADDGPTGVFQLMKSLKDPEISRSIGMMMRLLKGMGKEEE